MVEHRFEDLIADLPGIVWEADGRTFRFLFVSQHAERLLGYPLEQWHEEGFWVDHLHPDDRERAVASCVSASSDRRRHELEYRMIAADGRVVWLYDTVNVREDRDGNVRLRGLMVDITRHKQDDEAVRLSHALLSAIFDATPDSIFVKNLDGRIVMVNAAAARRAGVPASELVGKDDFELFPPDSAQAVVERDRRIMATGAGETFEEVLEYAGVTHTALTTKGVFRDVSGKIAGLVGIARDITDRKKAEQERLSHLWFFECLDKANRAVQWRKDLDQLMRDFLDAVLDIFSCDRAWLLCPCDPSAETYHVPMERTRPEFPGAFSLQLSLPVDAEVAEVFRRVRSTEEPVTFGPGGDHPLPETARAFAAQSQMCMAVYPNVEQPYLFGLHQCRSARIWTAAEQQLFKEMGRRLADALTGVLVLRSLRESERKLAQAEAMARVGYWELDFASNRLTLSDEAFRLVGALPENRPTPIEESESLWRSTIHPDDRERVWRAVLAARREGAQYDVEYRVVQPSGAMRFAHSRGEVTFDAAGTPLRMFGFTQDVTERREAEDKLRASEARFRTLVDHATDAFYLHDAAGIILDVNRQACEALGYDRSELIGMSPYAFDVEPDPEFPAKIKHALDDGEVLTFETAHRRKDGSVFPVEVRIRPFWENGQRYSVSLARDITERKRTERELVESHTLLNAVVEGTPDAVFVKDLAGRYLMVNSAAVRLVGKPAEEIIGKEDRDMVGEEKAAAFREADRRALSSETLQTFEETLTVAGVTRSFLSTKGPYRDARGKIVGLIGISRDITDLKRLEEQFRQSQKMEAIGRLAGGVAHDFNNLLTVINGYSELVLDELTRDHPGLPLLAEVRKAGDRASDLTRKLLAFSRRQVLHPQVTSLNELLGEVCRLLEPLIGEDIELSFVPAPELGVVKVDPGLFEHAVINLAVNARDAMPGGGRLIIETHSVNLDESFVARVPDISAGRYSLVAVTDTGQGMDGATMTRIFEPFFTTKPPGKGTGLGLAMVYGFVKQSGGHVEVHSEPGLGTTFKVYLPCVEGAPVAKQTATMLAIPDGTETVLLVEDEDAVRALSRLVLESHGYTVLEARDGQEGLRVADGHAAPIHLLITDLVMPRMGGRQLAEALRPSRARMRVLFVSGYSDQAVLSRGELEPGAAFLQKPFTPITLARKVRAVLDSKP